MPRNAIVNIPSENKTRNIRAANNEKLLNSKEQPSKTNNIFVQFKVQTQIFLKDN